MPHRKNGNRLQTEEPKSAMMPYGSSGGLMSQIRDEFDRFFERFTRHWPGMSMMRGEMPWSPGLDVRDEDNAVKVRAELPGFDVNDIDLQVNDDRLVIRAKHESDTKDEKTGRTRQEREYYQAVSLPSGVHADKVDAHYAIGVLTVTMPKSEQVKYRRIEIRED